VTLHVIADNWQDLQYDWWWNDSTGGMEHSATPSLDRGFEGGGGSPGVHFDGLLTFGTNAPVNTPHAPNMFVIRVTPINPNGAGGARTNAHSY
jgi:hypothetical protein